MKGYLGIDVGSVSTNLAVLNEEGEVICHQYLLTHGQPIQAVQKGLQEIYSTLPADLEIRGVGTTGSARQLTGLLVENLGSYVRRHNHKWHLNRVTVKLRKSSFQERKAHHSFIAVGNRTGTSLFRPCWLLWSGGFPFALELLLQLLDAAE